MKLTRLRQQPNCLPIVEVERDFLFASMMLAHIERLPDIAVLSKRSSAMSDSFEAYFEYKKHTFYMGIPFGCIMVMPQDSSTPTELLNEIAEHIDGYRTVWPVQLLWSMTRYFFLPQRPTRRPGRRFFA
jgi:hypothetical protein